VQLFRRQETVGGSNGKNGRALFLLNLQFCVGLRTCVPTDRRRPSASDTNSDDGIPNELGVERLRQAELPVDERNRAGTAYLDCSLDIIVDRHIF